MHLRPSNSQVPCDEDQGHAVIQRVCLACWPVTRRTEFFLWGGDRLFLLWCHPPQLHQPGGDLSGVATCPPFPPICLFCRTEKWDYAYQPTGMMACLTATPSK